jgi:hypothetical protein
MGVFQSIERFIRFANMMQKSMVFKLGVLWFVKATTGIAYERWLMIMTMEHLNKIGR